MRWVRAIFMVALLAPALTIAWTWGLASCLSLWTPTLPETLDTVQEWPVVVPSNWPIPEEGRYWRKSGWAIETRGAIAWPKNALGKPDGTMGTFRADAYQIGWPWYSLKMFSAGEIASAANGYRTVYWTSNALSIPDWISSRLPSGTQLLPISPVWPGFLATSGVFGALVAALYALTRSVRPIREWLRARKGLCTNCTYPVAGMDTCPECGRASKKSDRPKDLSLQQGL